MITTTEVLILNLLLENPDGCYGSELVHLSEGKLKRSSIYALLGRAETSGLIRAIEEPASATLAVPRTRYKMTAEGRKALIEFAAWTGLSASPYLGSAA